MRRANGQTYLGRTDKEEIEEEYFQWLCRHIDRRQSDKISSRDLAAQLHGIIFTPLIPNDDNREGDGTKLRENFYDDTERDFDINVLVGPCSLFEMLVALSIRINFEMVENPEHDAVPRWFWLLVDNVGFVPFDHERNEKLAHTLINRHYGRNGKGGLFPLKKPVHDQRQVEIWYQLMAYLEENFPDQ